MNPEKIRLKALKLAIAMHAPDARAEEIFGAADLFAAYLVDGILGVRSRRLTRQPSYAGKTWAEGPKLKTVAAP